MILSAHQPAYLPWLGYLDKIQSSDMFIYLDTVQFEKNSFINRNKIKTSHGEQWLTIPVQNKGHISSTLIDTKIIDTQSWRVKHLKSIEINYKKAPYFSMCYPKIEELLSIPVSNLSDLCWQHLNFWLKIFDIQTKIIRSSELKIRSKKSDLVLDMCKYFSANTYISGALGKNYLNESEFSAAQIKVVYQNFKHPIYPQLWGNFMSHMSIIDYWMNCGSGRLKIIKGRDYEF